jgi:septum site-determining protein MinD
MVSSDRERKKELLCGGMEKCMSEVIVVTSGKGGVGKTTTSANVGTGLAKLNKKVVLIDTDIGLRNLDVVMGLENRIVYNLVDVVEGNCRYKQALIKDKRYPNLYLLPSAQTRDKTSVSPEQMKALTDELREEFDYIILDCPAGIEQGFKNAIAGADRALVVTTPEVSAIRDADRIIGLLEANDLKRSDLIVNRIRMDMVKKGDMMSIDDVVDILSINLIGAVPDDENIVISTNNGEPLAGNDTLAGQAYMNICKRVMGEEVPLLDLSEKSGFWSKLKSVFSSK